MARKQTLDAIIQLYKKLGGNTSEVLGTKTNINFLGKGKTPEPILEMDINAEALGVMPQSKAIEELTNSVGYALSGKLNDLQANKLLENMSKMDSFYNPPKVSNITDLATGTGNLDAEGIMTLRNNRFKKGITEKYGIRPERVDEVMDTPFDEKLGDDVLRENVRPIDEVQEFTKSKEDVVQDLVDRKFGKGYFDTVDDVPPPGSRGGPEDIAAPFTGAGLEAIKNVKNSNLIVDDIVNKIYLNAGVAENAQPVVRANAREFLNRIKDLEDPEFPGGTTLSGIMEADDFKFMTEGGGGGMGDPFLLVQKYFGPKVAASIAKLDGADDIQKFAENLVKIKDARGNSVTSRYFDPESVSPDDFEFADGGKVPAADSQLVKETEGIMGYRGKEGFFPNFLKHGYFSEKEAPPRTEKLDTVKEIFEEDTPNIQDKIDLSEGFTLSPITILRRILAEQEIKKADGGRVPMFAGGAARMGYQALAKYGIKPKDISRLFASLGTDKSLVGKEKTEYFRMLHKVLRNPDDFPDEILDIQKQLGIDIPGLKSGGLAGILEV